jgi:hypothetical protein
MNKLLLLLLVIALVACVACQKQQAQEQQKMTQRDSSASPSTSPEKRYDLKSQAQKVQPRRIVPMTSPSKETPTSTPTSSESPTRGETSPVKGEVPQRLLDPILKEAAALANVAPEQLVIVRAESVVWNDGSLGCPEPGMEYTQALVNGYWVVVEAAGKKYDFRVGSGGSFRLCPPGQGQPPSQPVAN